MSKYNSTQRRQAAVQIGKDMAAQNGVDLAPPAFVEAIIPTLDDTDIGYALGEIQGAKHAKDWSKHSMNPA